MRSGVSARRFFSVYSSLPPKSLYGIAMFYYRVLLMLIIGRFMDFDQVYGDDDKCKEVFKKKLLKEQSLHDLWENGDKISGDIRSVLEYIYGGQQLFAFSSDLMNNVRKDLSEKRCDESIDDVRCGDLIGDLACIVEYYPELLIRERAANIIGDMKCHLDCIKTLQDFVAKKEHIPEFLTFSKLRSVPLRVRPTNYYALLYIDTDSATPFFQGATRGEILATAASGFLASEPVRRGVYSRVVASGMPGFIGGDDAVFFLPPEDAFRVLEEYAAVLGELDLKVSAAVVFAHSRVPLRTVVGELFNAMAVAKSKGIGPYRAKNSLAVARITGTGKKEVYVIPEPSVGGYGALREYVEAAAYYAFRRNITPSFSLRLKFLQKALKSGEPSLTALAVSKLEEALEDNEAGRGLLRVLYSLAGTPDKRPIFRAFVGLLSIVSSNDVLGSSIFPRYKEWGWE